MVKILKFIVAYVATFIAFSGSFFVIAAICNGTTSANLWTEGYLVFFSLISTVYAIIAFIVMAIHFLETK